MKLFLPKSGAQKTSTETVFEDLGREVSGVSYVYPFLLYHLAHSIGTEMVDSICFQKDTDNEDDKPAPVIGLD